MATLFLLGTHGSDDPTRASLPFHVAVGAIEAGHQPQVGLGGEAVLPGARDALGLRREVQGAAVVPSVEFGRRLIEQALQRSRQNKSRAADLLAISRPRLYRRIKELNIPDVPEPDDEPPPQADGRP